MRRFIKSFLFFSFPIILVAIISEISLRNIPNDYTIKSDYLNKNYLEIETLILGNSHAYRGFNPRYFSDRTFNAANVSQSIDYDFRIFHSHKEKLKNLKNIVCTISYNSYFSRLKMGESSWRAKNYNIYFGFNPFVDFELTSNSLKYNFNRLKNFYLEDKSSIECDPQGYSPYMGTMEAKKFDKSCINATKRHRKKNNTYLQENIKYISDIAVFCEKENKNLLLITPPVSNCYRNNLNDNQLEEMMRLSDSIAAKYMSCKYMNMMQDSSFKKSDFYNADHLNDSGASKLSVMVNKFLSANKYEQ